VQVQKAVQTKNSYKGGALSEIWRPLFKVLLGVFLCCFPKKKTQIVNLQVHTHIFYFLMFISIDKQFITLKGVFV
jgi:hypothetical protein